MKKRNLQYIISLLLVSMLFTARAQDGETLFKNNCSTCHELGKKLVGPDLVGVTTRRDSAWMASFISNSRAMIDAGDKDAIAIFEQFGKTEMTAFGGTLQPDEIGSVINYLRTAQPVAPPPPNDTVIVDPLLPPAPMTPQEIIHYTILSTFASMIVLIMLMIMGSISVYLSNTMTEEEKYRSLTYKMTAIFHGDWRLFTGRYVESSTEGHEYDGIKELDNIMPPWLQSIFYITILFAIGYLVNYQVLNPENNQAKEYQDEMAAAVAKYGDLDVVKIALLPVEDKGKLAAAKDVFVSKCATCHKEDGGGGVGPNLTDAYWLHGGSLENIFYTIRNGVPQNGMISWKGQITDEEMLSIATYIREMQGTTPADPKAPQGDKYVEE